MPEFTEEVDNDDGDRTPPQPSPVFFYLEAVCIITFTVEYILRCALVGFARMELARDHYLDVLLPYCSIPGKACEMEIGDAFQRCCRTMRYLARPMNIVDLLAIFPFWLDILLALLGNDASNDSLAVIRILRLARVFRVFKVLCQQSNIT